MEHQPGSLYVYRPQGGVASPRLFSRRGGGIWLCSGTGFDRASRRRATASRSEACDGGDLRLHARVVAVRELAVGVCSWRSAARRRFLSKAEESTGADKLEFGRQLLGPRNPLLLALVLGVDVCWPIGVVVSGTCKLGIGRQLLGPGSLLHELLGECTGRRGRLRQANPDLAWM